MKRIIMLVAAMLLVLGVATAFADEMPTMTEIRNKEVGAVFSAEAPEHITVIQPKRFRGDLLYTPEDVLTGKSISGEAPGGVSGEDETTTTWDNLMGPPGGSELP